MPRKLLCTVRERGRAHRAHGGHREPTKGEGRGKGAREGRRAEREHAAQRVVHLACPVTRAYADAR